MLYYQIILFAHTITCMCVCMADCVLRCLTQTLLMEPGADQAWTVQAAPAPDDVCWNSLCVFPWERRLRAIGAKLIVSAIVIFPIGVFTSSMQTLSTALCSPRSDW